MKTLLIIGLVIALLAAWFSVTLRGTTQELPQGAITPLHIQHYPTYNPQQTIDGTELQNSPASALPKEWR